MKLERVLSLIAPVCPALTKVSQAQAAMAQRNGVLALLLALCMLGLSATAHPQTITVFDAPGAGTGPGQGTQGIAINPAGEIAGAYTDQSGVNHGFLRAPNGTFATFDVPGAGTGPAQGTFVGLVGAINPAGAIAGAYTDQSGVNHGFVRAPSGTFATFDVPGAGTGPSQGTLPEDINPEGVIAGEYSDTSGVSHGFLRTEDGTIIKFDVLGAGTGLGQGTFVSSVDGLTPAGAIGGFYIDQKGVNHGYVRPPDGAITTFDVPAAGTGAGQGTFVGGINSEGAVMSLYVDPTNAFHGYVRAPDGAITTFDILGGGAGPGQGTVPEAINAPGTITGNYIDAVGVSHGFIRAKQGAITTFDVPGAGAGPGQGTVPFCNNPDGAITGWEIDANTVYHGFLRNGSAVMQKQSTLPYYSAPILARSLTPSRAGSRARGTRPRRVVSLSGPLVVQIATAARDRCADRDIRAVTSLTTASTAPLARSAATVRALTIGAADLATGRAQSRSEQVALGEGGCLNPWH